MTELLFDKTLILSQIPDFVDCCIDGGARYQAYWLVKRLWASKATLTAADYEWANLKVTQLVKINSWTKYQANHLIMHSKSKRAINNIEILLGVLQIYHERKEVCFKMLNESSIYLLEHWIYNPHTLKKRRFAITSDNCADMSDSEWIESQTQQNLQKNCKCDMAFNYFMDYGDKELFSFLNDECKLQMAIWAILMRPNKRPEMIQYLSDTISTANCNTFIGRLDWKAKHILNAAEHCREYPIVAYTLLYALLTVARKKGIESVIIQVKEAIADLKETSPELCDW